jgi:hypothetical protein
MNDSDAKRIEEAFLASASSPKTDTKSQS